MSLLMLKTKNLSWQDHTLNIEVMLAPLRSTLLLNKHKTLDTKYDKEKALYERQRDACIKDYILETRLIERRRQKIINRKKELQSEARSKSAVEKDEQIKPSSNQERSNSAPIEGRTQTPTFEQFHSPSALPKLGLKHTPLFGGTPLRPRMFLETGPASESDIQSDKPGSSRRASFAPPGGTFLTGDGHINQRTSKAKKGTINPQLQGRSGRTSKSPNRVTHLPPTIVKTPVPPSKSPSLSRGTPSVHEMKPDRGVTRRMPNVTFLNFLGQVAGDDDDEDGLSGNVIVEVKQKTTEDKVREFIRELDNFNSRPPTACSATNDSVYSSTRDSEWTKLVANRPSNHNIAQDRKLLEKSFDRYCEKRTHEDLLKAMKLASKLKTHIRQARHTNMVPTMANFKSSRTFMKILKRQQRRDRQTQECN